ncbi:MAG TPA: DUF2254 family protein [Polyangiaceae bacterium]|jgi:hypothetical protein|nr:DUF2254 family protein [Polyangiaceae bacterium]
MPAVAVQRRSFRVWLLQVLGVAALATGVFWLLYAIDSPPNALGYYFDFDPSEITDATASLAGLIAAVFGIVITVVSIILQLSASRFTGVTHLFFADRLNLVLMTYYIVVCIFGVWLSLALHHDHAPTLALGAMLCLDTLGLALMVPYFGYVFWFLEPVNIVSRIRRGALAAARRGAEVNDEAACFQEQSHALSGLEQLTDISTNSISGKDKIIASGAVDALKDFALSYAELKTQAPEQWFRIGTSIRSNPDFVAMDPESLTDLESRRTWVEWKVLRQCLGIYNEALTQMRDINYLIAIDTRYIGERALAAGDVEALRLVHRFMNSYLRVTINAKDVRTAYNVLNQYRLLVEAVLRAGQGELALEGVGYMKYYGHVSFDQQLTFVTETVAYDVSALCEIASELRSPAEAALLKEFLDLDRPSLNSQQEKALLGVRKAQVKLACYYLTQAEEGKARTIAADMSQEPRDRLLTIRRQLEGVRSKDFWEIIDRGHNFEFMRDEDRSKLPAFFAMFDDSQPLIAS